MAEHLTVALLVLGSGAYAVWNLAPRALRAALARGLLRLPLPASMRAGLLAASRNASGCGCSGCDRAGPVPGQAGTERPITLHRPAARKR